MVVSTEGTIDIEVAGDSVALVLQGNELVGVHIRGDAATDYAVDVKTREGNWLQDVTAGYSAAANYDDVIEQPAYALRVRCATGTGTAGDSATITLIGDG